MNLLFIGERRSPRAIQMRVRWHDGRLAAKQLFDALRASGIDPATVSFTNWFERGGPTIARRHAGTRVAMGEKVQRAMRLAGLTFIPLVHPAARGKIRGKQVYAAHVAERLGHL